MRVGASLLIETVEYRIIALVSSKPLVQVERSSVPVSWIIFLFPHNTLLCFNHFRSQPSDIATNKGEPGHISLYILLLRLVQEEMVHTECNEHLKGIAGIHKFFLCLIKCPSCFSSLLILEPREIERSEIIREQPGTI
jgi:hypothetical protein